ncbi:MAG: hypothetical protein WAQ08_05810 [Aquabacterium sp.]|uniref:hypothetical protein n=1 Tax=Aquabacterium sp. TaxID=1872578 RepID=UPI003BB04ACC
MNAPINAQALAGVQVAEWKSLAALTGKTFAQVAVQAMKSRLKGRRVLTASDVWADLSERTRDILVIMATGRANADRLRWDQLTEDEQFKVGALARSLLGELSAGALMLRP